MSVKNSTNQLSAVLVDKPLQPASQNYETTIYWNDFGANQTNELISLPTFKSTSNLQDIHFSPHITCFVVNGHTQGMLIPKINMEGRPLVFMADLLPSVAHIPLPYVMGYDMQPLITLAEKELFLNEAVKNNYNLFFEHDAFNECCSLHETEKGIRANASFSLHTWLQK